MSWPVFALCAGRAIAFRRDEQSAIAKHAIEGRVAITARGLTGDEQADLVHHGGPDMAVHHYPLDHHDFWRDELGAHDLLARPGAFGSNLSVSGLREDGVHLGDRFRLGSALLEACQPRQPCWKIEHRFGHKGMVKTILETGRCGWFYRVLEEGEAQAGDMLERVDGGLADWPMTRIFNGIWGTSTPPDTGLLREISQLPLLAEKLRAKLAARLDENG